MGLKDPGLGALGLTDPGHGALCVTDPGPGALGLKDQGPGALGLKDPGPRGPGRAARSCYGPRLLQVLSTHVFSHILIMGLAGVIEAHRP